MEKFYSVSETITPTLAWGFLGTDHTLRLKCNAFKASSYNQKNNGMNGRSLINDDSRLCNQC